MGQQQLILLVLATIIVGLAIVVGIRAFNENSIKANSDAIVQDLVRMANDGQAWKQKPAPFGGQVATTTTEIACKNDSDCFTGLASLAQLGYPVSGAIYTNLNGTYTVAVAGADGGFQISGFNAQFGNCARLTISGITDTDIVNSAIVLADSPAAATQGC